MDHRHAAWAKAADVAMKLDLYDLGVDVGSGESAAVPADMAADADEAENSVSED